MLRQVASIRRNPLAYLDSVWRQYGDVVQFPIPRPPSYLVNDLEGVRRVLVGNHRNYGKSTIQYRSLALVTGEGLLVADTEAWRRQRTLVQPAFHHEALEHIEDHVGQAIGNMFARWAALSADAVIDVDAAMMHGALEVVGHALFGTDLSGDAERLTKATLSALDVVIARARGPVAPPAWAPTPANRRLRAALRELDGSVLRMIAVRAANARTTPTDMLDLMLSARDQDGSRLGVKEIRDQVVTFIVAGHETVASALTWSWALLASHSDVQRALQGEADAVLQGRLPAFADYERLPLARAVLDESLRLFPPAWLITRKALSRDTLGGRDVPPSSLIIMSPWLVHRHPALWKEPEAFRPERFLNGEVDRDAYLPFGAGPRLCIGRDFALIEGVLMLAAIAGRYSLAYPAGRSMPAAEPLVTIRPRGGLSLRLTRRR
jgi:cytochrome P450